MATDNWPDYVMVERADNAWGQTENTDRTQFESGAIRQALIFSTSYDTFQCTVIVLEV